MSKELPHSIEAEYALLGAILYDNAALERVPDRLQPRHFYEPCHQRMYETISEMVGRGQVVEPIGVMERMRGDPAFEELGGLSYLGDMVDQAPPAPNAGEYAEIIHDMAVRRELVRVGQVMAQVAEEDRKTPGMQQLELAERALFDIAADKGSAGPQSFTSVLEKTIERAAASFGLGGGLAGIPTGFTDLDAKLGGLSRSDLIIVAGRPSMGKTALATNIAFHVARTYAYEETDAGRQTTAGGVVAFFSLEMSDEQLGMRILAEVARIPSERIRKGEIDANEFAQFVDAAREIQGAPLHIDDQGALHIATITTRCRRLKRTVGLDLVVVDYLQLATGDGDSSQARIANVTQGLKALAKALDVPVIALSQVSRECEKRDDKRPQLSDLRESGAIEQDADVVMFVFREAYYLGRSEPREGTPEHMEWEDQMDKLRHQAEVIIAKQRHGPIGTVKLAFDEKTTKFSDLARGQ